MVCCAAQHPTPPTPPPPFLPVAPVCGGRYLMVKFQQKHRVSVERVVSGRGLANIFEFLCQHADYRGVASPAVVTAFELAGDLQGKVK